MVHAPSSPARCRFGSFELQFDERRLLRSGTPVALRPLAFEVLAVLARRSGHLVTKGDLLAQVWGKVVVEENTLQAHIASLRKVLGRDAIATVVGQGYRFTLGVVAIEEPVDAGDRAAPALPCPLTRFIGREREIPQVCKLLASTRLLTLTGAGGCGKTRLALEVARASMASFAHGVVFVELGSLSDPTLVGQALARALDVEVQPGADLATTLVARLRQRRLLLLLDNAEHLLAACATWSERLLRQCPELTVLVTSRERLGLDGEMAYRVPSLSVPEGAAGEDPLAFEAVTLFMDRARLHRPDFRLADGDDAVLVSVCRRLDGIALAIELAAAQVRIMSLRALHRGLDDRFRLLGNGSPTALPRHRTLGSLIDWCYDRLTPTEKMMFRRAGVFAGGWTLDAAQRVCGGQGLDPADAWSLLTSLADKSLVIADTSGDEPRFRMLETVRHFALHQLRKAGEYGALHDLLVSHLMTLVEELDTRRADSDVQRTLKRLDKDIDNLRAAFAWCGSDAERAVRGLRLAGRLNWFWFAQSLYREGRAWVEQLLAAAGDQAQGEPHALALYSLGALASVDGDSAGAVDPLKRSIDLFGRMGSRRDQARSLYNLAEAEKMNGECDAARRHFQEAFEISREVDEPRVTVYALGGLGHLMHQMGESERARPLLEEALAIGRRVGPWWAGYAGATLGEVLHGCGDLQEARRVLGESAARQFELGDLESSAQGMLQLAQVCQDMGDLPAAREHLQRPLDQYPRISSSDVLDWLEAFAGVLSELAGPLAGARLWGCAERHSEGVRRIPNHWTHNRQARLQIAARKALADDPAFDRAWRVGRTWTLEEAFRYARTQA